MTEFRDYGGITTTVIDNKVYMDALQVAKMCDFGSPELAVESLCESTRDVYYSITSEDQDASIKFITISDALLLCEDSAAPGCLYGAIITAALEAASW